MHTNTHVRENDVVLCCVPSNRPDALHLLQRDWQQWSGLSLRKQASKVRFRIDGAVVVEADRDGT